MKIIDLHTHSTASDGSLTPSELAELAKEKGLSAVALTDHDTVNGVDEFLSACKKNGTEGIAGVEVSAKFRTEMHILGLFVNYENEDFIKQLEFLRNARYIRNKELIENLQNGGFDISEDDIFAQKPGADLTNTGRAHVARVLTDKGYVPSVQAAFDMYLSKGKPYYVPRKTYPPRETIELIKAAGGVAVLAHPVFITRDETELEKILSELKGYGLDGVETYYSGYDEKFTGLCEELSERLGLLRTGGSDFHGSNKPEIELGKVYGGHVSYDLYEKLKEKRSESL